MSPRTPQQFKEMRDERMAHIMDVALEHFANEGYYRTTIRHIARHAGISKGLMYNYFESKEALLRAIIQKSVDEAFMYMDVDRDGFLSEEEFEFFMRKVDGLLKGKKHFWQLLIQLLTQKDVREQFRKVYLESDAPLSAGHEHGNTLYPSQIIKMIRNYFMEKSEKEGKSFDPDLRFEMFVSSLLGYAIKTVYSESDDVISGEKTMNRLIELFI